MLQVDGNLLCHSGCFASLKCNLKSKDSSRILLHALRAVLITL